MKTEVIRQAWLTPQGVEEKFVLYINGIAVKREFNSLLEINGYLARKRQ